MPAYQGYVFKKRAVPVYDDISGWPLLTWMDITQPHKKYLQVSEMIYRFMMSGWIQQRWRLYWKEGIKQPKNTCSNGQGHFSGPALYQIQKENYLHSGLAIYNGANKI